MKEYLETVVAPRLRGDGGWADVLSVEGDAVRLQLQGECSKCHVVPRCMDWIKDEVRRDLGREVTIEYVRKKPFFWDVI